MRAASLVAFVLLPAITTIAEDGRTVEWTEVRAVVEQYQAVLQAHGNIVCEYTFSTRQAPTVEDAFARRWIPGSPQYTNEGVYMSRAGKVVAREYSLNERTIVGDRIMQGARTEFLTNEEWRALRNPHFGMLSLGSRGHLKNDRWGPKFTPWSLGMMGNTRHLPGTENFGVYRHIMDNLDSSAVAAEAVTVDVDGDGTAEAAVRVMVASGKGSGTRHYYFTTPEQYGVPLLSRLEHYLDGRSEAHTVGVIAEYRLSPYDLPFPARCLRISFPAARDGVYTAVWTEVTRLEKPDDLTDDAFRLDLRAGELALLEDSGIGLRLQQDLTLGIESMPLLEQKILQRMSDIDRGRELADANVESHRTNYLALLGANAVAVALIGLLIWRRRAGHLSSSGSS